MVDKIKITKGLDIPISGGAGEGPSVPVRCKECAVIPDDFPGYRWKPCVAVGDKVLQGAPIAYARENKGLILASPISGEVKEIRRGERRHLEAIVLHGTQTGGKSPAYLPEMETAQGDILAESLAACGLWCMLREMPFGEVPQVKAGFRDVYITGFDSAPLAAELISEGMESTMEKGLEILSRLTLGSVYLFVREGSLLTSRTAQVIEVSGPHPAGDPSVHIALTNPINKGERILTLDTRTAVRIGRMAISGEYDSHAEVAVTGPGVKNPYIALSCIGARVDSLLEGHLIGTPEEFRIISGNVLTGKKIESTGYLHFPYRQLTLIDEGKDKCEFMGWASLSQKHYSAGRTFLSGWLGRSLSSFRFDARLRGGVRAPIFSGQIDGYLNHDIYPEYLLRAIQTRDFEAMENLGIYEVVPEDFALAEFADTSKRPLQQIVAEGLKWFRENN